MKISKKRRLAVYNAIRLEILDVRLKLQQQAQLPAKQDTLIAQSVNKIWCEVKKALGIDMEPKPEE